MSSAPAMDCPSDVDAQSHPPRRTTSTKTWLARSRAWMSILIIVPAGFLAAFSVPRVRLGSWSELAFEALGWTLFFFGAISRWWATLFIGGRKGSELVCSGPYSMTRNPLYFGTFLMLMAIPAFVQSLFLAAICLVVSAYYLAVTVPGEERRLAKKHGQAFADYCRRVPTFFPRVWLYQPSDTISVNTEGLRAEFIRSLRWAALPILCEAFVHFRAQPWWPHWFGLP